MPINYILPSIDEISSNIPLEYRRAVTEEDHNRIAIKMFLLYRKLRHLLVPDNNTEDVNTDVFPLEVLTVCNLKKGESYHLNTGFLKGKNTTKIIMKGYGFNHTAKYVVEDSKFFILSQITNGHSADIEMIIRFSKIIVQDKPEPNVIMLVIDQENPLTISFENDLTWIDVRNSFKKKTRECKENELRLLKSFVQESFN